jgi:peptidoglycan/xylan/chitin deacetylase (PgdA/CDA1 family)
MASTGRDQANREQPAGNTPARGIDPVASPSRWVHLSRRWIDLPAALLTALVVLAVVLPAPPIRSGSVSLPAASFLDEPDEDVAQVDPTAASPVVSASTPLPAPASTPMIAAATPAAQLAAQPETQATVADTVGGATTDLAALSDVAPNELGGVPIIMYHAFTTNPAYLDEWTLTFDTFREQLDWYREHDFVMVGVQSMIDGRFDVPAGKKPIILTFDDASAGQFGLQKAADGGWEVKPDTAVGVIEEYRQKYPEFAGPAFFAILSWNCFASDDDPSTCEDRLNWLVDHGYEIGNHTWDHVDMTDVSDDFFVNSIASMIDWLNERVPADKKGNLSHVVVMPFGAYPDPNLHPEQRTWLADGFWWQGDPVNLSIVMTVNGGPAISPYSMNSWPSTTYRIASDPGILGYWQDAMETGEAPVFISDGNPDVVTIPADQIDNLDEVWVADHKLELRTYDASDGGS